MMRTLFGSTLRILMLATMLGGGFASGCAADDSIEENAAAAEQEPEAIESSEAPLAQTCRTHRDCRGDTNFCCNRRCRRNFPGLRCVDRGGGAFE